LDVTELRGYQEADLPRLVKLLNGVYQDRHEFVPYTEVKLQKEFQDVASILLAVGEQKKLEGMALLRRAWYGEEIEVCARPESKQSEIESQLLAAIERETMGDSVTVVVAAQDRNRIKNLRAQGYEVNGGLYQFVAELQGSRALPLVPEGYFLRTLRPDEEDALISVVNTAYQSESRLRPGVLNKWKSEDPSFSETWVQVAECRSKLVAAGAGRLGILSLDYGKRSKRAAAASEPASGFRGDEQTHRARVR
jgi:hypothetical protein